MSGDVEEKRRKRVEGRQVWDGLKRKRSTVETVDL
jgi:hypothetical protein